MTHLQIRDELARLFKTERENNLLIMNLINEAEANRTYIVFGYPQLFKWLVHEFKLSNGAAARRLAAARLLKSVPEAKAKLEDGSVNLSTLCQTQISINAQEKATGEKVSNEKKAEALKAIENKTSFETEKVLANWFPESLPDVTPPKTRRLRNNVTRCSLDFTDEDLNDLKRLKEILSHTLPHGTDLEVIRHALKHLLRAKDPLKQPAAASKRVKETSRAQVRLRVFKKVDGACEFVGLDGHRCGEKAEAQSDHIVPRAKGGHDSIDNLRLLCRQHNLFMAEQAFGRAHMDQFRRHRG